MNRRVVVVTGASSGLGRRFALDLAENGAVVVAIARREALLATLDDELRTRSSESSTEVCDVSDVDAFTSLLADVESRHQRVDVLINNAGISGPDDVDADLESYRGVMEVNYFAPVAGALAVLPGMIRRGQGVIVNVSSDSGRAPGPRETAYTASKAALSAFSESLAFHAEPRGVQVHVLYPGWVPTAMGQAVVDSGRALPPRAVRRTEEQVSKLLLAQIGSARIDIDATRIARLAPAARAFFPGAYRRGVKRASG